MIVVKEESPGFVASFTHLLGGLLEEHSIAACGNLAS